MRQVRLKQSLRVLLPFFLMGLAGPVHSQQVSAVVQGEYIVKMKSGLAHKVGLKMGAKGMVRAAFAANGTFHVKAADESLVADLKNDPDVEYVEPNFVLQSIDSVIHAQNLTAQAASYYDQTGSAVKATEAWAQSSAYATANRPIVAIVDTGLDKTHSVFVNSNALWVNTGEIPANQIDDDNNGYVDDVNGWNFITGTGDFTDDESHGTHVAGIVLGATQDILATTLQPAKIRLMPLKFLDSTGSGSTAAAINAIYYAVNMGAKVINCSWGGGSYSRALQDAMTYAYNHGVLVTTAAGNYSSNNDVSPMYPANYTVPSNISVAATTDSDVLASFSNFGATSVAIGSPGLYVFSTMPGNTFATLSGTSMAAPFIAGSAALALRESTSLTGYQLKSLVTSTADSIPGLHGQVSSSGRVNVLQMVVGAQGMTGVQAYQPTYVPVYQVDRSVASDSTTSATPAGCGLVKAVSAGAGPGSPGSSGALAILFGLPFLVWFTLRRKAPQFHRRFERYTMESQVMVRSNGRELVGTLKTISMGGACFNVDEALERGGSVTMKITGPEGSEAIEVEGRVVWSERNQSYGVQFNEVREGVRETLFGWTRKLMRQEN